MSLPLCPILTLKYQTWQTSLVSLETAKNRFQETGSDEDKKVFDEALANLKQAKLLSCTKNFPTKKPPAKIFAGGFYFKTLTTF